MGLWFGTKRGEGVCARPTTRVLPPGGATRHAALRDCLLQCGKCLISLRKSLRNRSMIPSVWLVMTVRPTNSRKTLAYSP